MNEILTILKLIKKSIGKQKVTINTKVCAHDREGFDESESFDDDILVIRAKSKDVGITFDDMYAAFNKIQKQIDDSDVSSNYVFEGLDHDSENQTYEIMWQSDHY